MLLADGKVLVTGGDAVEKPGVGGGRLASAELYDPASGTWSATASMVAVRDYGFTATVLADGKVLVAGGMAEVPRWVAPGALVASAELYDPGSGN